MFYAILEWIADRSLIVAGVALAVAILLRFEKTLRPTWKRRLISMDVAFAVAVFFLGALKEHLDAKWKTELDTRVEKAQQAVDEANQRLLRIGPRHITKEQSDIIARQLSSTRLRKDIQIHVNGSDGEALEFANELLRALAGVGVSVGGEASTFAFVIPPGQVNIVSNTGELDPEASVIKSCLESAGMPVSVFTLPAWPGVDSSIFLFVGSKMSEPNK